MKPKFKWRHYQADIILFALRWYASTALTYRQLANMLKERGLDITHTTIMRWIHHFGPELNKRSRPFLKKTNSSFRCDETYIKVKGKWKYLYRAVDSNGQTLDFLFTAKRDHQAAIRFFNKLLNNKNIPQPRVINTDKNPSYPTAIQNLKSNHKLNATVRHRKSKYLNKIIEQDHRRIKRYIRHCSWFQSFKTATKTISAYETMHMIYKGQVRNVAKNDPIAQMKFIANLFCNAA